MLHSQTHQTYLETFGNPEQKLIDAGNPDAGIAPADITDNPFPLIYTGVSQRTPVNYGAQPGVGAGWNLSADYCSTTTYGRYGIVTSNVFDSEVPVSSKDDIGNGFFAFFRRYTGYTSVLQFFVPEERVVPGAKYTLSGWGANGYGANVPNCDAVTPGYTLRIAHFPATLKEDGIGYNGTWSRSDIATVFNSSTWTAFSKESPGAAEEGKGMFFQILVNATKSSMVLFDEIQVTGERPVLTGTFTPISLSNTSESSKLSETRSVSCNHAGSTPITLTISGENASCFTLCDASGAAALSDTLPKTGGNYRIKFTPDGSAVSGNYSAILTINSSTNSSFGAENKTITLSGTDTATNSVSVSYTDNAILFQNPLDSELKFVNYTEKDNATIVIIDGSGKQVAMYPNHALSNPLNVSYLIPGNYFVSLIFKNNQIDSYKFIKK